VKTLAGRVSVGRLARLKSRREEAREMLLSRNASAGERRRSRYPKLGSGNGLTVLVDLLFVFVSYSGYGWK